MDIYVDANNLESFKYHNGILKLRYFNKDRIQITKDDILIWTNNNKTIFQELINDIINTEKR